MAQRVDNHYGIGRHGPVGILARHRHATPYAALVLTGGYMEAGDLGRHRVRPGDILAHGAFDAHQDWFGSCGAEVLNLPLAPMARPMAGRVADPDAVARLAETDLGAAAELALTTIVSGMDECADWPDLLAIALRADEVASLAEWAFGAGIAPTSLSRGFRLAYGVSPQRYRAEFRARRVVAALMTAPCSLAAIAADAGFADQPHMTREVARLAGQAPGRLRRAHVKSVQDGRTPAP
ncbi:MAG TPA: AraC family transcriptional regulator [Sphingomicrobium sp.]|nr:AraC family transcriptional regulator [Sphingomicrobium sp.]